MKFIHRLLTLLAAAWLTGCAADYVEVDRTVPPYFHSENAYVDVHGRDALPRRVLVLPSWGNADAATLALVDTSLIQQLTTANVCEVIPAPSTISMTHRPNQEFTLEEASRYATRAGADGVLLCRITSCQPYRPIAIGANLRIWNFQRNLTSWAVDETMDSQLTTVANGARNYYLTRFREAFPTRKSEHILESPSMFFQYAFAELFSTIPGSATRIEINQSLFPKMQKE